LSPSSSTACHFRCRSKHYEFNTFGWILTISLDCFWRIKWSI
jgi:hypothetical protein